MKTGMAALYAIRVENRMQQWIVKCKLNAENPGWKIIVETKYAKRLILGGSFAATDGRIMEFRSKDVGCGVKEVTAVTL